MPIAPTQEGRPLTATTPMGEALVAVALRGEEAVSRPFLFTVDFVSTNASVSAANLLGKPMTLHLPLVDGSRPLHGLVRRFTSLGRQPDDLSRYRVELVPALWFLSLSSDCQTFEKESALDIVEKVCKANGVTDVERRVTAAPAALDYVVQYRESNLAFVSRMLEAAGLYYTFEHAEDKHTLVFADVQAGSIPAGVVSAVKVDMQLENELPKADTVFRFSREYTAHAASVSLSDHDLLRADSVGSAASTRPGVHGERFDFLGDLGPNDSAGTAKQLIESEESEHDCVHGASSCAGFQAGTRVTLSGGPLGSAEAEFHLLRVSHRLEVGDVHAGSGLRAGYQNEFTAIPAATRYRPPRATPRPSVRGTQTAKVVGSGGTGEIDVDADARVLLQFPWDRGFGKDGGSQHRVHVASIWAGTGWGAIQLPRIGQEVLVEYLEGDPARPIVTGRVYNSTHKPPYALPGNKTQAGTKSRTLGGGADNFNELRFEDKKGDEHVFLQAEKNLQVKVKNDETREVLHDRTTTIKHDDTRTVQEGNDSHTVSEGNQSVEVTKGDQTVTVKQGNQTVEVSQGDQAITVAQGKQTVTVHADQEVTIRQGKRTVTLQQGDDALAVKMGNLTIEVDVGNISVKAKAGKITIEAMQGIDLKVGSSTIQVAPQGVTIKGPMVTVEAQAQAQVKGAMVSVQGQAMTQVKGAMTQVNGDGMLMLKGGITMIN